MPSSKTADSADPAGGMHLAPQPHGPFCSSHGAPPSHLSESPRERARARAGPRLRASGERGHPRVDHPRRRDPRDAARPLGGPAPERCAPGTKSRAQRRHAGERDERAGRNGRERPPRPAPRRARAAAGAGFAGRPRAVPIPVLPSSPRVGHGGRAHGRRLRRRLPRRARAAGNGTRRRRPPLRAASSGLAGSPVPGALVCPDDRRPPFSTEENPR